MNKSALAALLVAVCAIGSTAHAGAGVTETTTGKASRPELLANAAQGRLIGRDEGAVKAFLGIRYAAPPVGANRWRVPQPAPTWKGARLATDYGASCLQELRPGGRPPWTREYMVQGKVSEDCLTLNVWTPSTGGEKRPVLVWIHGGGFQEGSGSVPIYRGAALAGRGIVVVTVNYRLGMFGFFAHPELTREAKGGVASNFGLQDQIAALKWVRTNIAAFGGDPDKVTIAGQSAGAVSVHDLIASPLAKGLFARAIAQSGLPTIMPMQTLAEAERNGLTFAHDKGAASLAQLRAMSPSQLALAPGTAMGGKYRFGPVVDGRFLPSTADEMIARGTFNDVPTIVGQTADEGSAFPGYGAGDTASYNASMMRNFGAKARDFGRFYPAANDSERSEAAKVASRDRGLAMIAIWSRPRLAKSHTSVWSYYFNHAEPGEASEKYGAFHSSEIPYLFETLDMAPERNFAFADRQLSLAMATYWVNFIKRGDPNSPELPAWRPLASAAPTMLELTTERIGERALLSPEKLSAYRDFVAEGGALSMF
jgi:para-nitrobenzyl esterase